MPDRYDRQYDRDRRMWRDRDDDDQFGRGEFGGSTRRGWGPRQDFGGEYYGQSEGDFGRERGFGRDYEPGWGGQDWREEDRGQGWGRGQGMGRGSQRGWGRGQGMGHSGQQGWGRSQGMGREGQQAWGRGEGQGMARGGRYGYGQQGQGWQPDYGQGQQGWMDDYEDDYDYDVDYDTGPVTWTYTEYWLVPGPFTGVGPDDYHRTSDRICEDVCERLSQHGRLDASNIHVEVDDEGVVTLTGTVDSRKAKRMAEDTADSVWGVTDIRNELRVENGNARRGRGQRERQAIEGQRQTEGQHDRNKEAEKQRQ
jgi:hypothetical protein